jgi:RNA polymerase subunit RPABC4/transcription elongation factor Spt4
MPEEKVCAACGRRVWSDDHYCPGCGIAFGAEAVKQFETRVQRMI